MDTIELFYSWQSDTPPEMNQNAIRTSLSKVILDFECINPNKRIIMQEATSNMPGSPVISETIFDRIQNCDIFVADITTINSAVESHFRKVPNPNVLIELGYAIAILGWERIILLFNKQCGKFPDEIPFDIQTNRVLKYKIKDKGDSNGKGQLFTDIKTAINQIIEMNPKRKREKIIITKEAIEKARDTETIERIFKFLNIGCIDFFIEKLPYVIIHDIFYYQVDVSNYYNSRQFFLYDENMSLLIGRFISAWEKTLSFSNEYDARNGNYHFVPERYFGNQKVFEEICEAKEELNSAFGQLVNEVKKSWHEIDVNECSKIAFRNYQEYQNKYFPEE